MIRTEIDGGIATVIIDRPHRLNALTWETMRQLHDAIDEVTATDGVRAVVLTGSGRAFCSGADLTAADTALDDFGAMVERNMITMLNPLCQALLHASVPIIAAVNGPCAGGGLGVALLADITIAARSAYFLVPQVATLGIAPDAGATWILARHVGRARALGMSLTGARISAEQAELWGLIWRCVDDDAVLTEARAIAAQVSSAPTAAVVTRGLVDAATSAPAAEQLDREARAQRILFADPAAAANIARFAARSTSSPAAR